MTGSVKGKYQPVGLCMEPTTTEFGAFVRGRRIALRMSQVQLSTYIPRAPGNGVVSALELGVRGQNLAEDQIIGLARGLQVDVEELRSRMPKKHVAVPTTEIGRFILARREVLGMSLEEFAQQMDMMVRDARRMEMTKSETIPYWRVVPLARALQVDSSALIPFVGRDRTEPASPLGKMIRDGRKAKGLKQKDLASMLGITRQWLNQIERSQHDLHRSAITVEQFAAALDLDLAALRDTQPLPPQKILLPPRKRGRPMRRLATCNSDPDVPETLGTFLTQERVKLGLTQQVLAERAGVGASTICSVETGRRVPRCTVFTRLVRALGCEVPVHLAPPFWRGLEEVRALTAGESLGAFFVEKRKALGITQAALARRAKISLSSTNAAELGRYPIGRKVYSRIVKALKCDVPAELVPVLRGPGGSRKRRGVLTVTPNH